MSPNLSPRSWRLGLSALATLVALYLGFFLVGPAWAEEPPRVISLYAAHTENLLRLGARACLVGISAQETYAGPETQGWVRPEVFSAH
ncbi:MAG: hypothetical protein LBR11_10030, partial [Deltaproteobacteria bacterium]|nr:hypothetical protein [Deltaproteobacteria bacterium]